MEQTPEEHEQPEIEGEQPGEATTEPGSRAFLEAVRAAAGWRVSPRQVVAAVEALGGEGESPTPEQVAELASATRGEASQRQRRHPELWRALGAQLALEGAPSDPQAQLAFIGTARRVARRTVSDALLLQVALSLAASGSPLDPELVGRVARWLARRPGGPPADADEIEAAVPSALAAIERAEAPKPRPRGRAAGPRPARRRAAPSRTRPARPRNRGH